MIATSHVVGFIFTIMTLLLSLLTIRKGYRYKHTIDPLEEGGEVRVYTDNGERSREIKKNL